jgi:hypothetical protein
MSNIFTIGELFSVSGNVGLDAADVSDGRLS